MLTKQQILDEIKRSAKENGGVPLGIGRFEKETGVNLYNVQKYWSTFGEAQREAGFTANTLQIPHSEEFLLESVVTLIRELGRFPTKGDFLVKRNKDSKFPNPNSIHGHLGNKKDLATKIVEYCKNKSGYDDIIKFCEPVLEKSNEQENFSEANNNERVGEVYLFKSGRFYKIGMTNDTVRRGHELRIQLPEKMDLIHSIKTDDPSGVEAYWHRRFESKRMNGEWFDLSSADIKAFKRWRRIY